MFQDGDSGSSAESSDEMEHGEENNDLSERLPSQGLPFSASNEDKVHQEELNYNFKSNSNCYETNNTKSINLTNDSEKNIKSEQNLNSLSQISNILSSRNVLLNNLPAVTTTSSSRLAPSLPLMVTNSITSANLSVNITPSPVTSSSPNQFQALPLLVQTPGGVGYASTPDGMVLALLQGANVSQPQLVALPTSSIGQTFPKPEPVDKNS